MIPSKSSPAILANPCLRQSCCLWKTVDWPTLGQAQVFQACRSKLPVPSIQLILIESNKKKCAFLSEVVRALELTDVEVRAERFEQIRPETVLANIITSRAVGEFKQLLRWSSGALVRRGHLMLWVGAEDSTRIVWQCRLDLATGGAHSRFSATIYLDRPPHR